MANTEPVKFQPLFLRDMTVIVRDGANGKDYARQISAVTITPTAQTATWKGGKEGASYTAQSSPDYAAAVEYAQDWDNADSLANYLFANQGKEVDVSFVPTSGAGVVWDMRVILASGAIGGTVGAHSAGSVTWGLQGAPKPRAYTAAKDGVTAPAA